MTGEIMKRRSIIFVLTAAFVIGMQIACHQPSHHAGQSRVVLPNPELLKCRFGECAQMWSTGSSKSGANAPWRVTIERLGNDPCPNGIIALYDKNVSMEELVDAVTEQYGPVSLRGGALPGGTWRDASKKLVIDLFPLADEPSPEANPSADAMKDPFTYFFTTDTFHDSVGRSVPRKELKELIILSMFNTSCGVPMKKAQMSGRN
jgi:hypothetical protein